MARWVARARALSEARLRPVVDSPINRLVPRRRAPAVPTEVEEVRRQGAPPVNTAFLFEEEERAVMRRYQEMEMDEEQAERRARIRRRPEENEGRNVAPRNDYDEDGFYE